MKKFINLFYALCTALFLFFAVQLYFQPQLAFNSIQHRIQHPFDMRLRYAIGDVDPRFGMSPSEVKKLTEEAVQIWHDGLHKEVFVYDPTAKLKINLVYDEHQAKIDARSQEEKGLDRKQAHREQQKQYLDQQKQLLENLKIELAHLEQQYQQSLAEHQALNSQYQQTPQQQMYQVLRQKTEQLNQLGSVKNQLSERYNAESQAYNDAVDQYNASTQNYNQQVEQFNQTYHMGEYQQGVFTGKKIDIYTFESLDELKMVIAHELGHGLNIEHNDDPDALMYPVYRGQNLENFKLKQADIDLYNNRPSIYANIQPR
ncbi:MULTISPECIES: matrixin family metalloprotease [unclassified Acinetobacter]|uniref:matrixin family metalloprotease n=1 Tax=unclassified Acinetobacter TaxID=196816 RepID=UPI0035B7B78F